MPRRGTRFLGDSNSGKERQEVTGVEEGTLRELVEASLPGWGGVLNLSVGCCVFLFCLC